MSRCADEVWRAHQLQALPQNNESTVEGVAGVARSWFMFEADLCGRTTCRAAQPWGVEWHPHRPKWGRAE